MKLGKRVVGTVLLVCFAFAPYEASAQKAIPPDLCNTSWFRDQAAAASKEGKTFLLLADTLFEQGDYSYVVATRVPRSDEGDGIPLLIFAKRSGATTYRKIYEEEIPTIVLILTMMMEEKSPRCVFPHYRPYFDAAVVDLDANGRLELIVEANEVGACRDCHSQVRVYQLEDQRVSKEVEEWFQEIHFGTGKVLTLGSYGRGLNTKFIPIRKQFFVIPKE